MKTLEVNDRIIVSSSYVRTKDDPTILDLKETRVKDIINGIEVILPSHQQWSDNFSRKREFVCATSQELDVYLDRVIANKSALINEVELMDRKQLFFVNTSNSGSTRNLDVIVMKLTSQYQSAKNGLIEEYKGGYHGWTVVNQQSFSNVLFSIADLKRFVQTYYDLPDEDENESKAVQVRQSMEQTKAKVKRIDQRLNEFNDQLDAAIQQQAARLLGDSEVVHFELDPPVSSILTQNKSIQFMRIEFIDESYYVELTFTNGWEYIAESLPIEDKVSLVETMLELTQEDATAEESKE